MPPSKRPSSLGKYQYNSRQPQPQPPKQQQYQQHAQQQQQQQQYQQPQYQQQQRQQYQQQQQQYQHQLQQQREEQWKSGSNHSEESSASSSSRGSNNSSNSPSNTSRASRPSGSGARESMAQKKRTVLSEQRRSSGASQQSRAASYNDSRQIRSPPCIFDIFFDLPHPGASKDSERARMIEPPNDSVQSIVAELYEASAISRLARFAFPEHDDHQHALDLQTRAAVNPSRARRRNNSQGYYNEHLNKLDIYVLGFRSERHTFSLTLSDGETKLYGHTLRYLPHHQHAKSRSDVGRRGVRAMVILTRAVGGDGFYTAVLKSIESALVQGNSLGFSDMEDPAREKAMRLLHGLHRLQAKKYSETMMKLQKITAGPIVFEDDSITLSAIEYDIRPGGYIQGQVLPGDFIKMQVPPSLQAGFKIGAGPDDFDAPVLPLLRALGAGNTIRVISALMCERRIIFVSENVGRLSACVRAASSLLAQGQLIWRYSLAQVLPPHLLSCLAEPEPYIVGLLDEFLRDIELLQSLSEVLCVHLDKNQFKTFGMKNPGALIPDMLTKSGKETVAHILYSDMQQILKAEARIWGGEKEKGSEEADQSPKKGKKPRNKEVRIETDMALLFHRVMRGASLTTDDAELQSVDSSVLDPEIEHARLDLTSGHLPRKGEKFSRMDPSTMETFDVCENERGEEGLRAALAFFFLVTHGDLGSILSEGPSGGFLLDRKKYLLHKKKDGNKETSPLFTLYKAFSGSSMLEYHLSQRIEEFDRGKSLLMPRHRSLFSLCEKHLRSKKLEFSYTNIRNVVSKTTIHSPLHAHVERSEMARARALTLTSAQPFDGNVSQALSSLVQDCHQCDSALPQTVAVVWSRLDDSKISGWKHPLLGLHLLKNLLIHGPISIISYALDGVDKVRRLRFYDLGKSDENNKEVRESAKIVWELITDCPRLLLKRKQVLASRAKLVDTNVNGRWGGYLLKKVPFHANFRQYHTLLRPKPYTQPGFMMDNRQRAPYPKDSEYLGRNVQDMDIMRMSLTPNDDGGMKSHANAAADLKRMRDLQSARQAMSDNSPRGSHPRENAVQSARRGMADNSRRGVIPGEQAGQPVRQSRRTSNPKEQQGRHSPPTPSQGRASPSGASQGRNGISPQSSGQPQGRPRQAPTGTQEGMRRAGGGSPKSASPVRPSGQRSGDGPPPTRSSAARSTSTRSTSTRSSNSTQQNGRPQSGATQNGARPQNVAPQRSRPQNGASPNGSRPSPSSRPQSRQPSSGSAVSNSVSKGPQQRRTSSGQQQRPPSDQRRPSSASRPTANRSATRGANDLN